MPSAAQLIEKYIELRDSVLEYTRRYEEDIKPYTEGMQLIENVLAEEINRLEGQAIKTQFGTAYRSTLTSFKVADRDAWFNWVFENNHRNFLTAHVAKEAVKEHIDTNGGGVPPGLSMTQIYRINVLRSTEK